MKDIKHLSKEEKMRLLCGKDGWSTVDFDGKIPQIRVSDGPVGLRKTIQDENGNNVDKKSVAYPAIQCLANTWNRAYAKRMGETIADDCLENDVDILLAPGVNIKRDPLCGRNFEYFSEDPFLAGSLSYEYIKGLQSQGIGACLKHYYCNNLEQNRFEQSSDVDERTLREIYLKPFEMASKAKPISVMCSYNRINGVYASENKKGFAILRNEFGFDGAVISDWDSVRDRTKAAKAGLDLEMPFNQKNYDKFVTDCENGKITDEEIDACAERVMGLVYRCKEMQKGKKPKTSQEERLRFAREIAEEGIVLLKNEGVLPLKKGDSVAICGEFAAPGNEGMVSGGGSSKVAWLHKPYNLPDLLNELGYRVFYSPVFWAKGLFSGGNNAKTAFENAAGCDISIICVGTGQEIESEGFDRDGMRLPRIQEEMILQTAEYNPNTVVILFSGAAVDMRAWKDKVAAILFAGFAGEGMGSALADILAGIVNPSGKLAETFPLCLEDCPSYGKFRTPCVSRYEEGLDVGYRYYNTYNVPVAYPFGYGLSYSRFAYKNLEIKIKEDGVLVRYTIENISDIDGKEISQIYVQAISPYVYRPKYELKEYSKNLILAGQKKCVEVFLEKEAFAYYSTAMDCWTVDDGCYKILIGASSQDIRLNSVIFIENGRLKINAKI